MAAGFATALQAAGKGGSVAESSIVFESNRTGNWELYSIGLDGNGERALTTDGADNQWPAISPDGRIVAWTLTRGSKSGVWFMDRDGGNPREAAPGGSHASFLADGRLVFVKRVDGLNTVWTAPVDASGNAGAAELVFDPRTTSIRAHDPIEWSGGPALDTFAAWSSNPRGTSLFHAHGSWEHHIHKGCMPRFLADGLHFLWVRDPGHFGVGRIDGALRLGTLFRMEQSHPFNHAYFPFLSADARWLVFAACPEGQHNHDTSNYQIFLQEFQAGSPSGEPRRLTQNDATDRQPVLWTPADDKAYAQIAAAYLDRDGKPGLAELSGLHPVPGFSAATAPETAENSAHLLRFNFAEQTQQSRAAELFELDDSAGFHSDGLRLEGGDGARFIRPIGDLIDVIRHVGEFHIAMTADIAARDGTADGRILSFRLPREGSNFLIYQEGALCHGAFKDGDDALDAEKSQLQGKIPGEGLVHLAVTYRNGRLRLFINGRKADEAKVRKNPKTWNDEAELVLGGPVESRRGLTTLLFGPGRGWRASLRTLEIGTDAPGEEAIRDAYRTARRQWPDEDD